MVKINFGVCSRVGRKKPGVPLEDRVIDIPKERRLTPVKKFEKSYASKSGWFPTNHEDKLRQKIRKAYVGVSEGGFDFPVKPKYDVIALPMPFCIRKELLLVWIKERKEWVGIGRITCLDQTKGGLSTYDQNYEGPFALNEKYAWKIVEAYGIERKIPDDILNNILRTSPSQLERISKEKDKY